MLPVTPSRNELVDPTGLKPAPHGLKGRCSVSRAPGQDWLWRKDSNLRMAALTVRCLTNLATPQSGGYGWIRTTNLALMRRLLYPLELHSRLFWKPAEELNLVPVRPALAEVRFRRPMPGSRALDNRISLRPSAYLCGLGVKNAFNAENARIRRGRRVMFGGRSWNRTNLSGFSDPH